MQSVTTLGTLQNLPEPPDGALICVDLDGTLVRSDTLFESITPLLRQGPKAWFSLLASAFKGRAALKEKVALHGSPRAETLAWREELIEALRRWKVNGHRLVLATASHRTTAEAVQAHLGLFDHVIGTEENRNLRGKEKLSALRKIAQGKPIWYLGDSSADLPLWKEVDGVAIAPFRSVARKVKQLGGVEVVEEKRPSNWIVWSRALRLHQWAKNGLLFLPAILAHQLQTPGQFLSLLYGFFAFSTAASSIYLLNDLLDLPSDRLHPVKKERPLAAGWLSFLHAFIAIPLLLLVSALFTWKLGNLSFALTLSTYLLITTLYSLYLKKVFALDILVLTTLYIIRLFAGSTISATPLSFWLIAFGLFFFSSLAILKRVTDLQKMVEIDRDKIDRRGYTTADLPTLRTVGIATSIQSIVVLAFYMDSDHFRSLYSNPEFFWLAIPILFLWLMRVWIITGRGEMLEDPVLFTVKDPWSWLVGLTLLAITWLAYSTDLTPLVQLLGR